MVDKVSEEVEVGKKESGIIHGREKKVDSKRRDMQTRIYKKAVGIYLCMEVSICECVCMGMYVYMLYRVIVVWDYYSIERKGRSSK